MVHRVDYMLSVGQGGTDWDILVCWRPPRSGSVLPVLVSVFEGSAASIYIVEGFCNGKVVILISTVIVTENLVLRHFIYV